MKMQLKTAALVIGALAFACNNDGKKEKDIEGETHASGFSLKAELCGSYPSIGKAGEKEGNRRPISIELAMAICGNMEGSGTAKWSALGMVVASPDVYLKKPNGPYDSSDANKGTVWIEDDSKVIASFKSGKKIQVGTVTGFKPATKIKLADGVAIELVIGDRLYQISDAKNVPDSEKKLFISAD
jgi:hypothetical protein